MSRNSRPPWMHCRKAKDLRSNEVATNRTKFDSGLDWVGGAPGRPLVRQLHSSITTRNGRTTTTNNISIGRKSLVLLNNPFIPPPRPPSYCSSVPTLNGNYYVAPSRQSTVRVRRLKDCNKVGNLLSTRAVAEQVNTQKLKNEQFVHSPELNAVIPVFPAFTSVGECSRNFAAQNYPVLPDQVRSQTGMVIASKKSFSTPAGAAQSPRVIEQLRNHALRSSIAKAPVLPRRGVTFALSQLGSNCSLADVTSPGSTVVRRTGGVSAGTTLAPTAKYAENTTSANAAIAGIQSRKAGRRATIVPQLDSTLLAIFKQNSSRRRSDEFSLTRHFSPSRKNYCSTAQSLGVGHISPTQVHSDAPIYSKEDTLHPSFFTLSSLDSFFTHDNRSGDWLMQGSSCGLNHSSSSLKKADSSIPVPPMTPPPRNDPVKLDLPTPSKRDFFPKICSSFSKNTRPLLTNVLSSSPELSNGSNSSPKMVRSKTFRSSLLQHLADNAGESIRVQDHQESDLGSRLREMYLFNGDNNKNCESPLGRHGFGDSIDSSRYYPAQIALKILEDVKSSKVESPNSMERHLDHLPITPIRRSRRYAVLTGGTIASDNPFIRRRTQDTQGPMSDYFYGDEKTNMSPDSPSPRTTFDPQITPYPASDIDTLHQKHSSSPALYGRWTPTAAASNAQINQEVLSRLGSGVESPLVMSPIESSVAGTKLKLPGSFLERIRPYQSADFIPSATPLEFTIIEGLWLKQLVAVGGLESSSTASQSIETPMTLTLQRQYEVSTVATGIAGGSCRPTPSRYGLRHGKTHPTAYGHATCTTVRQLSTGRSRVRWVSPKVFESCFRGIDSLYTVSSPKPLPLDDNNRGMKQTQIPPLVQRIPDEVVAYMKAAGSVIIKADLFQPFPRLSWFAGMPYLRDETRWWLVRLCASYCIFIIFELLKFATMGSALVGTLVQATSLCSILGTVFLIFTVQSENVAYMMLLTLYLSFVGVFNSTLLILSVSVYVKPVETTTLDALSIALAIPSLFSVALTCYTLNRAFYHVREDQIRQTILTPAERLEERLDPHPFLLWYFAQPNQPNQPNEPSPSITIEMASCPIKHFKSAVPLFGRARSADESGIELSKPRRNSDTAVLRVFTSSGVVENTLPDSVLHRFFREQETMSNSPRSRLDFANRIHLNTKDLSRDTNTGFPNHNAPGRPDTLVLQAHSRNFSKENESGDEYTKMRHLQRFQAAKDDNVNQQSTLARRTKRLVNPLRQIGLSEDKLAILKGENRNPQRGGNTTAIRGSDALRSYENYNSMASAAGSSSLDLNKKTFFKKKSLSWRCLHRSRSRLDRPRFDRCRNDCLCFRHGDNDNSPNVFRTKESPKSHWRRSTGGGHNSSKHFAYGRQQQRFEEYRNFKQNQLAAKGTSLFPSRGPPGTSGQRATAMRWAVLQSNLTPRTVTTPSTARSTGTGPIYTSFGECIEAAAPSHFEYTMASTLSAKQWHSIYWNRCCDKDECCPELLRQQRRRLSNELSAGAYSHAFSLTTSDHESSTTDIDDHCETRSPRIVTTRGERAEDHRYDDSMLPGERRPYKRTVTLSFPPEIVGADDPPVRSPLAGNATAKNPHLPLRSILTTTRKVGHESRSLSRRHTLSSGASSLCSSSSED